MWPLRGRKLHLERIKGVRSHFRRVDFPVRQPIEYVYASYIDELVFRYKPTGTESIYFHRNQQYSIVALTDGSGAIVERYAYSAYVVPTIADASGSVLSASAYGNRYMVVGAN